MAREGTEQLKLSGEPVLLDARRALAWPMRRTVVIADPHIGKDDTFRRSGIPVPAKVAEADFDRLSALLTDHAAERLVVLGDFLHARLDDDDHCIELMRRWRERFAGLDVLIVRGNHDAHAGPPPSAFGFVSVEEPYRDAPFVYRHYPVDDATPGDHTDSGIRGFTLAGHLHPGVTVRLGRDSAKRVSCFYFTDRQMILPAFGGFTGTGWLPGGAPGEVVAVGRGRLIRVPRPAMV